MMTEDLHGKNQGQCQQQVQVFEMKTAWPFGRKKASVVGDRCQVGDEDRAGGSDAIL